MSNEPATDIDPRPPGPLRRAGGDLWDQLDTVIVLHDPRTGRVVDGNRAAEELTGCTPEALRAMPLSALDAAAAALPGEALRRIQAAAAGQPQRFSWLGAQRGRSLIPLSVTLRAVRLAGHDYVLAEVGRTSPADHDADAEDLVIARLHASEARYRMIFEAAQDAIFLMRGARFIDCNAATARLFGAPREQLIGRRPDELSPPVQPNGRRSSELARELLDSLRRGRPLTFEWTHCRLDGTPFPTEVSLDTLELDAGLDHPPRGESGAHEEPRQGKFTLAIVRNITLRKQQEQLQRQRVAEGQQRQKLESLGTLAAGVAHEINNPLMGILNYAALLADRLENERLRSWAGSIAREGERVSKIVKNLLAFARQEKLPAMPARVEEIIEGTVTLLGASLRQDGITLEVEIADGLPPLTCRAHQIQQVLVNLLTNARDALNQRYPGAHEDKRIALVARWLSDEPPSVRISVSDRGPGVPAELRDRIFDPFFTTKPCDRGTGLGLSISFGLAREHGGTLYLDRDFEGGSRFHLDLPCEGD